MKMKWMLCAVMLIALPFARAENAKYISPEDGVYWHENASCRGEIMLEADGVEGYFACPVCVQEDVKAKITAVERGGTIILRMPDSWAHSRDDIGSVFGWGAPDVYEGEEAADIVAHYLHGDAYNEFMKTWEETGRAEAWTWNPGIYPENNELFMNERHIGGSWYVTMRPDAVSGDSIKIYLRFFGGMMEAEGDRVIVDGNDEWGETDYKLKFSEKKNKGKAFSRDCEGFSIDIYDELDTHIAVIRQHDADKDLLEEVRLMVDDQPGIILNGYMDGSDAVFCCTLSHGEDHLIRSGAPVRLEKDPWYTEEDFMGSPYALAAKDTGGCGVIDRDGNFVLGPGYDRSARNGSTVFLMKENRDWLAVNLDTMEEIAYFEYKKDWITIYPQNSAVFTVSIGDMWYIYENATGFPLASMSVNDENGPDYSFTGGIDGRYSCFEIGMPARLVFTRADTAYVRHDWLADNHGNRVTGNYNHIEPIIWNGDQGVFTTEHYTDHEHIDHPNNFTKYLEGFDGRPFYGDDWRVGLIDHNGNTIAPMEYVYIKVHSATQIELHEEDGTVEMITLG